MKEEQVCINLSLALVIIAIVRSSEKENIEIFGSKSCSKTNKISCSRGLNKVEGLKKLSKII